MRGEAASLKGRGRQANQALKYLAPGLQTTSQLTAELARDQPTFDQLVVQGANALGALASRSEQLSQLIANTSTATGAIASQSQALQQALGLLPGTLRQATTTFAGLQTTLNSLDPLVAASKPAVRRLPQFLAALRQVIEAGIPTIGALDDLIHNPSGGGDLTSLAQSTPGAGADRRHRVPGDDPAVQRLREPDRVRCASTRPTSSPRSPTSARPAPTTTPTATTSAPSRSSAVRAGRLQRADRTVPLPALRRSHRRPQPLPGRRRRSRPPTARRRGRCPAAARPRPHPARDLQPDRPHRAGAGRAGRGDGTAGRRAPRVSGYEVTGIFDDASFAAPGRDGPRRRAPTSAAIQSLDVTPRARRR